MPVSWDEGAAQQRAIEWELEEDADVDYYADALEDELGLNIEQLEKHLRAAAALAARIRTLLQEL